MTTKRSARDELQVQLRDLRHEPAAVADLMSAADNMVAEALAKATATAVKAQPEEGRAATPASPNFASMQKSIIEGVVPQIREFVLSEAHDAIDIELVGVRDLIRGQIARELEAAVARAVNEARDALRAEIGEMVRGAVGKTVDSELDRRIERLPKPVRQWASGPGRAA